MINANGLEAIPLTDNKDNSVRN